MIEIEVSTAQQEMLLDVTELIQPAIQAAGVKEGICLVSVPHTSAGLTLNSAFDPATGEDILDVLDQVAPRRRAWKHAGSPPDAEAHVKGTLVGHSVMLHIAGGALRLGTHQRVLLCEFDGPRARRLHVTIVTAQPNHDQSG